MCKRVHPSSAHTDSGLTLIPGLVISEYYIILLSSLFFLGMRYYSSQWHTGCIVSYNKYKEQLLLQICCGKPYLQSIYALLATAGVLLLYLRSMASCHFLPGNALCHSGETVSVVRSSGRIETGWVPLSDCDAKILTGCTPVVLVNGQIKLWMRNVKFGHLKLCKSTELLKINPTWRVTLNLPNCAAPHWAERWAASVLSARSALHQNAATECGATVAASAALSNARQPDASTTRLHSGNVKSTRSM
jgi:hypothetical protein